MNTIFLNAQNNPHLAFRQYTTDDGLASPETYHILQDSEGIIWISSDNGVSRFDGYEFRNYGVNDGLKENVVFMMQLDSLGRVWMQANSGNLYYFENDSIHAYWNNDVLLEYEDRADNTKGFLIEGAGETVHIATVKYGVISISKENTNTSCIQNEFTYRQVLEKNGFAINVICENGTREEILNYADELNQKNRTNPLYFQTSQGDWILDKMIYTQRKGSARGETFYLGENKYFFQIYEDVWLIENGKIQWHCQFPYHILYARVMNNGQLYVGLNFNKGLKVYGSINEFRTTNGTTLLSGQTVSYFTEDKDRGKWFATNENGIFYTPSDAFEVYDKETGLPDEKITALAFKNEDIYAGLGNGEVWHLDRKTEQWKALPSIPGNGKVRDLFFDLKNQQLWAGRDQLFYLKNGNWTLSEAIFPNGAMSMSTRITSDPLGHRLWVCNYAGIMSIDLPQMTVKGHLKGRKYRSYVIREDYNGRIWVGKSEGLFEWKDSVLHPMQELHPAFSSRIEDIVLMSDSTLVIATKGAGIVFWKDNRFEQITTSQGLTADMMENIYANKKDEIWAGTLNGLNLITGVWGNRKVEQFTIHHGLPSNEINKVISIGNNVWIATNKGLVHYSTINNGKISPRPILSSVYVNNQIMEISDPLIMSSTENNLKINFYVVNYKLNGNILYRYRINIGEWTPTKDRSIHFAALSPENRVFEVQAMDEDGIWSESATLQFNIYPPWWFTWWAKSLLALILISFASGFYFYRTRLLTKAHKIQLKIADLERSALQAQMNPHFIFNCLNSIQNYILQNKKESAIIYLGSFASLVRSMLNASVAGNILLSEEVKLLTNYLELEKMRFGNRFTYKVVVSKNLDIFEVKIPPLLVQPYVENALLHGISGKDSGGIVTVSFDKKEDYLEVSILDNGGGFEEKEAISHNPKKHKSFGMSITRNRLELLSNNKGNNHVSYKTLYDADGMVAGTQAIIRIRIKENDTYNK